MAKNENAIPGGERSAIKRLLTMILLLLTFDLTNARAQSGSPLENAKAMYDSASFDEALTVLDRLNRILAWYDKHLKEGSPAAK